MTVLQRAGAMSRAVPGAELHEAWPHSSSGVEAEGLTAKRIFDIIGVVLAFLLFGPLMFVIWTALALSGGNPIFCQQRVGRHGQPFRCYKFRSMVKDANKILTLYLDANPEARAEWDRSFKLARDPRVTWFGNFLRRTSMDELPQLFNVLKGEMSLVGPRPIIPSEVERYAGNIAAYYSCRPGITGLWQVSGRNLVSYERRVQLDALYARTHSLWLDATILIRTVRVVVSGAGAS
jgi:lipopolysaccharide/colanic/teichoic acid biosynthesis glycosyltransferase